ncbi:MAG: homoserine O-acetyltransferase [Gammaproteobacteria bacterium]|nr:homoserine O-acetyltransferase [Gammaproteobacteria bacterium]
MKRGGRLPEVTIAYESWGSLSPNYDNAILIFTGLSPTAHAASNAENPEPGWWEFMIGPGKAIDTDRFYVICVNSLGGCFGSTGPESINPATGKSYGTDFPEVTIEDMAKAGHHLLHELGIDHLHAVVGPSMGGMTALAYALQYPDECDYLISISAATRALPFTIAMRSLQREIIRCDPNWKEGHYHSDEEPLSGMLLARKLGLVSYRAAEEWHQRFDRARVTKERRQGKPFEIEFEVESYLDYNANKFVGNFDANSYLYMSRAMDWFDVADHGGSVNAGLAKIHVNKALIIGVTTDILFPIEQQQEIAEGLIKAGRNVEFVSIDSINGHDAFLVDREHFSPVIADFFSQS